MKVVFDTNILVSAVVFPGGRADEALRRIVEERDELFLSNAILGELLGVLAKKFARDAETLSRLALFLAGVATIVRPGRRLKVLRDAADKRILECAITARAEIIVTGDRELLRLRDYRGVRILALRDYLETTI